MPNVTSLTLAAAVRAEIAREGRRPGELAKHLGVTPAYVSRRMRGHVEWSGSELHRIAEWLDVPVSRLHGEAA